MPKGIFEEYLSGGAGAFFAAHFANARDRKSAVLRARRPLVPAVAEALDRQNARLPSSTIRDAHLAALRGGAAAVVTGQQVGLFLGPLYTLYKAATTIRVAEALAAESGHPVVPIFWLQTEDHDLPEIAECHAPCSRGLPLTLQVPASPADRISVAHLTLPVEVSSCLQELGAELAHLPHARAHLAQLERHYAPGTSWGGAFAGLLAEIFAHDGLVIIDPRDPALATATACVHRRALTAATQISQVLTERSLEIETAGYAPAVHIRPDAPLSFFHPVGAPGPRCRLAADSNGFVEVGGSKTHTLEGLLATLDTEPLRFSTSALLRPIVQDTLLPTAAYVAGPGEVTYLAQIAPLYAAYEMSMPLVIPRARLRILEEKTIRALERWGIEADDAQRSEETLLAMVVRDSGAVPDRAELRHTLLGPFTKTLADLRGRLERSGLDASSAFDKTRATTETAVTKLAERIERASLHRDKDLVNEVRRLKMTLYPHDTPQERYYGFSYFAARYGQRSFVDHVLAAIDSFDPSPKDLHCAAGPA